MSHESSHEPSGRGANRFVGPLPPNPNLDKQRKLAKALARDYWRGDPEAIERVRALHPKPPSAEDFVLSDAQLVVAEADRVGSEGQSARGSCAPVVHVCERDAGETE